jgi:hypothetical protein
MEDFWAFTSIPVAHMCKFKISLHLSMSLQDPFPNKRTSSTKSRCARRQFLPIFIPFNLPFSLIEETSLPSPATNKNSEVDNGHPYLSFLDEVKRAEVEPFTNKANEADFRQRFIHLTIRRQKPTCVTMSLKRSQLTQS